MNRTVAIHSLGCKVNSYEAESMEQLLKQAGYTIVPFDENITADIYIINTCSVTNIADRKSRQMLHKSKKINPDAIVVAAGCYVNADTKKAAEDNAVDIVLGNNCKINIVEALENYYKDKNNSEMVVDFKEKQEYEELKLDEVSTHTRAYIKIQDGCNQFCSYCIIPYTRGRIRSRDIDEIEEEVTKLVSKGFKEVVLTGIHLTSYGVDNNKGSLLEVIMRLDKIEGLQRIRLGSLEPRVITEEFAKTLSSSKKICPHFHLSLQSGCDTVLKRMNRKYTTQEYYDKCCILRKYFNNPAITTDVIVGFPQETEEEFEATKVFLEKVHFYEMHIFKYSRRKGTVADRMEGQVDEKIKTQRSAILLELENKMSKEYRQQHIGKTEEVLIEEIVSEKGKDYFMGFTPDYIRVKIACDTALDNSEYINTIKKVYMKELSDDGIVVTGIFEC
ncbi:MAG: tRNA (N(6)-L-threonylcarbamoyladenosine(37)-C(2))-methylthiotransferase MtaB [Lachnospira sp.]|jgi:threonylcarbamoyladenosine tRNA methylthiotransferase MtaB|uniref:tRNA (N(6)-L-threonylcarbamoyladenosine(37)-C(2))-methylthiotransferase MtaB n=1 Tax=Lachnospira intestinalis TaxID=3133158 RepID=A0ABV1GPE4_9FIRM